MPKIALVELTKLDTFVTELLTSKHNGLGINEVHLFRKAGLPVICITKLKSVKAIRRVSRGCHSLRWVVKAAIVLSTCNRHEHSATELDNDGVTKAARLYFNPKVRDSAGSLIALLLERGADYNAYGLKEGLEALLKTIED